MVTTLRTDDKNVATAAPSKTRGPVARLAGHVLPDLAREGESGWREFQPPESPQLSELNDELGVLQAFDRRARVAVGVVMHCLLLAIVGWVVLKLGHPDHIGLSSLAVVLVWMLVCGSFLQISHPAAPAWVALMGLAPTLAVGALGPFLLGRNWWTLAPISDAERLVGGLLFVSSCVVAMSILLLLTTFTLWARRDSRYPVSVAVRALLLLRQDLANATGWHDVSLRRRCCQRIELAAGTIERHALRWFTTGDRATDDAKRESIAARAAGIRELGLWFAVPDPATRDELARELDSTIENLACGRWHALKTHEPRRALPKRGRIWIRTGSAVAICGVAWAVFHLNGIPESIRNGLLALAAAALVSALDPRWASRVDAVAKGAFGGRR